MDKSEQSSKLCRAATFTEMTSAKLKMKRCNDDFYNVKVKCAGGRSQPMLFSMYLKKKKTGQLFS